MKSSQVIAQKNGQSDTSDLKNNQSDKNKMLNNQSRVNSSHVTNLLAAPTPVGSNTASSGNGLRKKPVSIKSGRSDMQIRTETFSDNKPSGATIATAQLNSEIERLNSEK